MGDKGRVSRGDGLKERDGERGRGGGGKEEGRVININNTTVNHYCDIASVNSLSSCYNQTGITLSSLAIGYAHIIQATPT